MRRSTYRKVPLGRRGYPRIILLIGVTILWREMRERREITL